ncbi:MAG: double-strand break repair helicase AddA [Alphaproteobacteria bacterium]
MAESLGVSASSDEASGVTDPNMLQRAASNPDESVWVDASAGTGKTKVLTDRVLRLLLPRNDGRPGTPPGRILCLTFTKAAANEMALRINRVLSQWAVMDIDHADHKKSLYVVLEGLIGQKPSDEQVIAAQRLFADVVDCPGGLQIMTIHSFCQSVLGRFPIEAGLPPNFDILEEGQASLLMKGIVNRVLSIAQSDEQSGSPLSSAVQNVVSNLDEGGFSALMQELCSERRQLSVLLSRHGDVDGIYRGICEYYKIDPYSSEDTMMNRFCASESFDLSGLEMAAQAMAEDKGALAQKRGNAILQWIKAPLVERLALLPSYQGAFLTQKGEIHKKAFPPKAVQNSYPQCVEILHKEAQRLIHLNEIAKSFKSACMTRDVLLIGQEIITLYAQEKQTQGVLDFDDLVLKTMALLAGETSGFKQLGMEGVAQVPEWIMYKLDQGLDHILVDEAQDTNPEQWRIIESLCAEFFSGMAARDEAMRTSFTVGDIKQSIYSFQRAAPEEFKRMQAVFDRKIGEAGLINRNIGLDISFRTTESVLRVVDHLFQDATLRMAVGGEDVKHKSFRVGQAGCVELWPVFESSPKEAHDFWAPPVELKGHQSGSAQLASYIADKIQNWLDRKEFLESANRPIKAGDIMILVRSRTAFVDQLVRSLKLKSIPVSGVDRMTLGDQLAVQDLLAVARFCLLPDDDLTLAEVLKTPFLGWNEDELFALSYNRKGTLWSELCNFDEKRIDIIKDHDGEIVIPSVEKRDAARDYLARLTGRVRYCGAYEFFSYILNMPCPADQYSGLRAMRGRLGEDALDPIEELLNAALDFGYNNTDHLQIFLDEQERKRMEIKREMEEGGDFVRIMTVHGSKGLQAPIVILPDTLKNTAAKKGGRFLWPDKTGLGVPFYAVRKDEEPHEYQRIHQKRRDLEEQEEYRLLYVAMTRAADRLYVSGHKGVRDAKENSWYYLIKQTIEADERCTHIQEQDHEILRVENAQDAPPDKSDTRKKEEETDIALPEWISSHAPEEPLPPYPLIPSRPSEDDGEVALSPLSSADGKRFRRGNLTHKLLQFLPDLDVDKRKDAALEFVHKNALDLSENIRSEIVGEVMAILDNADFAPFFSPSSMAEVSVTGLMEDNQVVSGQIDRLVITDQEIWIVDYKTNRPPPSDVADVPTIYKRQLNAYHDSIAAIYPNHKINCALLWTDGAKLMIL